MLEWKSGKLGGRWGHFSVDGLFGGGRCRVLLVDWSLLITR